METYIPPHTANTKHSHINTRQNNNCRYCDHQKSRSKNISRPILAGVRGELDRGIHGCKVKGTICRDGPKNLGRWRMQQGSSIIRESRTHARGACQGGIPFPKKLETRFVAGSFCMSVVLIHLYLRRTKTKYSRTDQTWQGRKHLRTVWSTDTSKRFLLPRLCITRGECPL